MAPARSRAHAALGEAVCEARQKRGLTQEQAAKASGIAPTYISDIERGVRNPSYELLVGLAKALGVPLSSIIKRAERGQRKRIPCWRQGLPMEGVAFVMGGLLLALAGFGVFQAAKLSPTSRSGAMRDATLVAVVGTALIGLGFLFAALDEDLPVVVKVLILLVVGAMTLIGARQRQSGG